MDGMQYFIELGARKPQPYARGSNGKFACPCCQYFTLDVTALSTKTMAAPIT
jgi:hypothetical protein